MAKVVRNMAYLINDIRENCGVNSFLSNLMEFCEENCEGKKIMGRLTVNFTMLSKIYGEIMT